MWIFGFSLGVCSMEPGNLVPSLEYLVSNGRQVLLGGIRLGGSATYGYMGPYKKTRYHLDDFRGLDVETLSRQEKFNLTHSRLRNVIEHKFVVLKGHWQILDGVPYYEREKQKMIIISCFAMDNFLWMCEHAVGLPAYPLSSWVHLNANNSMTAMREFISLALLEE